MFDMLKASKYLLKCLNLCENFQQKGPTDFQGLFLYLLRLKK